MPFQTCQVQWCPLSETCSGIDIHLAGFQDLLNHFNGTRSCRVQRDALNTKAACADSRDVNVRLPNGTAKTEGVSCGLQDKKEEGNIDMQMAITAEHIMQL